MSFSAPTGPLSPLLCNVYLHRLDRVWDTREHGVLVRYVDDAVVMCRSRQQAEAALTRLRGLLADLGLEPKEVKTRIVRLEVGGPGFGFLGFHHRLVRSRGIRGRKGVTFLVRWPSDKAMAHARDRLREGTARSRLVRPVEAVVQGHDHVLAQLECLLSLRPFQRPLRYDQCLRDRTSGALHREATSTRTALRPVRARLPIAGPVRTGPPERNCRRTQGEQALAGKTECRR
jgi:reverse transcriptase-like protein